MMNKEKNSLKVELKNVSGFVAGEVPSREKDRGWEKLIFLKKNIIILKKDEFIC